MSERVHNLSSGQARDELAVHLAANNRKLCEVVEVIRASCEATGLLNEELRIVRNGLAHLAEALEAQNALISRQLDLLGRALELQEQTAEELRRGREHMQQHSTPAVEELTRRLRALDPRSLRGLV